MSKLWPRQVTLLSFFSAVQASALYFPHPREEFTREEWAHAAMMPVFPGGQLISVPTVPISSSRFHCSSRPC